MEEDRADNLYPVQFAVSCAFIALKLVSKSEFSDDLWLQVREKMLQGSARLLGILVWKIQRKEAEEGRTELVSELGKARKEVEELKKIRREDSKANQKVASIFATQEQSWFSEKKRLKQQIGALFDEIQAQKTDKDGAVLNLNEKVQEKEHLIEAKDKALEEAEAARKEIEEKLKKDEATMIELRETVRKQAERHTSQILKHKTAFLELVSNQRQLEAEMGRALRQVESAKQELDAAIKQKEESSLMVQQLSMEVVKIRRDSGQKENILSAMLRKTKVDRAEKEMLLQELKISKVERKQLQLQFEKYRTLCDTRHDHNSCSGNLCSKAHSRSAVFSGSTRVHSVEADHRNNIRTLLLDYMETDHREEFNSIVPEKIVKVVSDNSNQNTADRRHSKLITTNAKQLEEWVRSETEKNTTMLEQRRQMELDAFAEQLRLKDEKSETLCWQLLSMELELEQLQSQNEGLDNTLTQLKKENRKLETLLLEREAELKVLNKRFTSSQGRARKYSRRDKTKDRNANWSDVKIIKTSRSVDIQTKHSFLQMVDSEKEEQLRIECFVKKSDSSKLILEAPEKEVAMDMGHADEHSLLEDDACTWKKDRHSMGVSYNIKRLKQQLLLLENLAGTPRSCKDADTENNSHFRTKGFVAMMSLLNKQVCRYQSLQEKIDDIFKRMQENDLDDCSQESKPLQNFLQETLQLQRYMVAVGQKLRDIHTRVASGFISTSEVANCSSSFDMKRFSESVGSIFNEVQKGVEVRLARLIGDIEETLTCDGIIRSQNTSPTPNVCIKLK